MATAKDTNARVTRWFQALQDYRFKVDHRPGREHANADALSRRDTCLWAVRGAPGLHLRGEECGNPAPTGRPLKPRGQVILAVYHPYPPRGRQGPHWHGPTQRQQETPVYQANQTQVRAI